MLSTGLFTICAPYIPRQIRRKTHNDNAFRVFTPLLQAGRPVSKTPPVDNFLTRLSQKTAGTRPKPSSRLCQPYLSARSIRWRQASGCFTRVHSQIRQTVHPAARRSRALRRSLSWLPEILLRHAAAFRFGLRFRPQSWPCQKQPSTKTASFAARKTKSGLPGNG